MTTAKISSYHHGDLARALLEATLQLLQDKGPESISMREVARQAGVSHAAPAHHFGDKSGLLRAAAIEGLNILETDLTAAIAVSGKADDPTQTLAAAGEAYIRFAVQNPGAFNLMYQSQQVNRNNPDYQTAAQAARSQIEASVRNFLGERASAAQVQSLVTALWSQVHGFSCLLLAGNFGDPSDPRLLDQLLPATLASIAPR